VWQDSGSGWGGWRKVKEKTDGKEKQETHTHTSVCATSYYTNGWDCGAWETGHPAVRFSFSPSSPPPGSGKKNQKENTPALYTHRAIVCVRAYIQCIYVIITPSVWIPGQIIFSRGITRPTLINCHAVLARTTVEIEKITFASSSFDGKVEKGFLLEDCREVQGKPISDDERQKKNFRLSCIIRSLSIFCNGSPQAGRSHWDRRGVAWCYLYISCIHYTYSNNNRYYVYILLLNLFYFIHTITAFIWIHWYEV